MKKNRTYGLMDKIGLLKMIKMMRFTIIILLLSLSQTFAVNSYSQQAKLSLDMRNVRLEDVLDKIEKNTEFFFMYNKNMIDVDRKVDIQVEEKNVNEVLNKIFANTDISYSIKDRQILLINNRISDTGHESINQQQKSISGKVTDSSGMPLPGVTVLLKGTTNGTITDSEGKYSIGKVPEKGILVFSFVGMKSQEVEIAGKQSIDILMQDEAIGLDEVVAIGYGTAKKSDLTGSVSSVQGDNLAEKNSVKVSQALQGSMPGLMVTRSGGAADASSTIRIRGITSIGDSNPLVIIDGIPGNLDWVNSNDIESISVLKDAASASIYGSRAAAGVILVTTKRAKNGQLSIGYNYEYSIEQPTRVAEYANAVDYMKVSNELSWNDNNNTINGEYPLYSKDLIDQYSSLHAENPNKYPDTKWIDLMLKDYSPRESHALRMTAGTKNINTSFSLVYDKTEALYSGRNYDRVTMRANNDVTINKYLSAEIDFSVLYSLNKLPVYATPLSSLAAPIYAAIWSDGRIGSGKSGRNDYALLNYGGSNDTKANIMNGKIQLNFTPIEGLKFSAVFSPEFYNDKNKTFKKKLTYSDWENPNEIIGTIEGAESTSLNESRTNYYSTTNQFLANYTKNINNHNVNLMVGMEEFHYFNESLNASRDQYALTNFPYLSIGNANYQYNRGDAYENAYRSFFGRIMYNYNNRYFIQANARYDGSSRFDKERRWGLFPSLSAGWVVSEESFIKKIKFISFLKVRASWGTLGNERIGNYPYQSTISFGSTALFKGNNPAAAQTAGITDYAIKDISWETTETYDFGLDANFFNNKLTATGDYYKKTTKDMLLALAIPNYMGVNDPNQNTGKMNTKGWEFAIGWKDQIGDLKYSVNANISDSKSIMGDLGGTEFLGSKVKFKGSEFNEWYGFKSEGLYQTQEDVNNSAKLNSNVRPGDIKYIDVSGPNGVPDGKISAEYDRVLLGGSLPRYLYGGDIRLEYKNFDFSIAFQGVGKQKSQITTDMIQPLANYWEDVPTLILGKYWSKYNTDEQNKNAKYPRLTTNSGTNNYSFSDYWLFNGAYFRLKNINLGYNIPKDLVDRCKLQDARLYINISDLFSIDSYPKGWDPEASNYWITRAFTLGVSLKF